MARQSCSIYEKMSYSLANEREREKSTYLNTSLMTQLKYGRDSSSLKSRSLSLDLLKFDTLNGRKSILSYRKFPSDKRYRTRDVICSILISTMSLKDIVYRYPAIDNHAHPLLKEEHRSAIPFEGLISEAQGSALFEDSIHTLACYRATRELAEILELNDDATWDNVKSVRDGKPYDQLCKMFMEKTYIQCLLLDDGLGGVSDYCHDASWHDSFTKSPTKRIVRVEIVAQV
jgi:hypothetical protein